MGHAAVTRVVLSSETPPCPPPPFSPMPACLVLLDWSSHPFIYTPAVERVGVAVAKAASPRLPLPPTTPPGEADCPIQHPLPALADGLSNPLRCLITADGGLHVQASLNK